MRPNAYGAAGDQPLRRGLGRATGLCCQEVNMYGLIGLCSCSHKGQWHGAPKGSAADRRGFDSDWFDVEATNEHLRHLKWETGAGRPSRWTSW